ncbi:hypothetical protein D3C71_22940 [compost metagenome]
MKLFNLRSKRRQGGFSMVEMMVVLVVISVLTILATGAFDGARTKAQAMLSLGKQLGDANILLKLDTGCYVKNASALFDPTAAAIPANNYCGRSFGNTWSRPYMAKYPTDAQGRLKFDKIGAEVTASFPDRPVGTTWKRYFVQFDNVPMDVIRQGLNECNGNMDSAGDFGADKCRTDATLSDEGTGNFQILFDETR